MILDINKLSYEARWFDFQDGVRLKIRPYPASMVDISIRGKKGVVFAGEDSLNLFLYCLIEWEGIVGTDDNPLPCTEEVKRKIYDFQMGDISPFVIAKARAFEEQKEVEEKN